MTIVTTNAQLNDAIVAANNATAPGTITITLGSDISLGTLDAINLHSGVTLDISVTTIAELNDAILLANSAFNGTIAITLGSNINLGGNALWGINVASSVTLDIEGAGHTLDGGSTQRGLFVYDGTVDIDNLAINNMLAMGGNGGFGGGGGGAGLGGGFSSVLALALRAT